MIALLRPLIFAALAACVLAAGDRERHSHAASSIRPHSSASGRTRCISRTATRHRRCNYPVLYLLHGHGGKLYDWATLGHIQPTADALIARGDIPPAIIVMPDAGTTWYVDRKEKMETAVIQDLVGDVQRTFRVIDARNGRLIAGLSMGGYGALRFVLKYPETFAAAAIAVAGDLRSRAAAGLRRATRWACSVLPNSTRRCGSSSIIRRCGMRSWRKRSPCRCTSTPAMTTTTSSKRRQPACIVAAQERPAGRAAHRRRRPPLARLGKHHRGRHALPVPVLRPAAPARN